MTTNSLLEQDGYPSVIFVYLLRFPNEKCYVGVSRDPINRLKTHWYRAKGKGNMALGNALLKHGEPIIQILHEVSSYEEAFDLEIKEISKRKTISPKGYNMTKGGEGVVGLPEEQRRIGEEKRYISYMKNTTVEQRRENACKMRACWTSESMAKMKKAKSTPAAKAQAAENMRQVNSNLSLEQRSYMMIKVWENPEHRKNIIKAQKKGMKAMSPEAKETRRLKAAASMKARWQDPEYRARRAAAFAKPGMREKLAANGAKGAAALTEDGKKRKIAASKKSATERWSKRKKSGDTSLIGRLPSFP